MQTLAIRIILAMVVLLCTIEALYWPLLMKPGTQLEWWQVHFLAQAGYVLGFGPLIVSKWVSGLPLLVGAFAWAAAVFAITGFWHRRKVRRAQQGIQADAASPHRLT